MFEAGQRNPHEISLRSLNEALVAKFVKTSTAVFNQVPLPTVRHPEQDEDQDDIPESVPQDWNGEAAQSIGSQSPAISDERQAEGGDECLERRHKGEEDQEMESAIGEIGQVRMEPVRGE